MTYRFRRWAGWALLAWAAILEHTVAKKSTWEQRQTRRNTAVQGAHDRDVPQKAIASWLGLEESTVKGLINSRGKAGGQ